MPGSNRFNQDFRRHVEKLIRDTEGHPLAFLLNDDGSLMTSANGSRAYFSQTDGVIVETTSADMGISRSESYQDYLNNLDGTSINTDACHATTSKYGGVALALGISESNRADGHLERKSEIFNEVILIGNVPVLRADAREWADAGLLDQKLVTHAPPSHGWTPPNSVPMVDVSTKYGSHPAMPPSVTQSQPPYVAPSQPSSYAPPPKAASNQPFMSLEQAQANLSLMGRNGQNGE